MPGGVCAVLDYEVEMMADYVSEMATRLVMPRSTVNAAFRKFVSQILTSTRLPSTTILLGMNYLAKRVNMMHAAGQNSHTEEPDLAHADDCLSCLEASSWTTTRSRTNRGRK